MEDGQEVVPEAYPLPVLPIAEEEDPEEDVHMDHGDDHEVMAEGVGEGSATSTMET